MSWLMIVLLVIASYLILVPLLTYLSAKRLIGTSVADGPEDQKDQLLYFYSQQCAPCRNMTRLIEQLAETHKNIHKIDVQNDPETARRYKIRATPTVLLVKDGVIEDVALGAKSSSQLEALVKKIS